MEVGTIFLLRKVAISFSHCVELYKTCKLVPCLQTKNGIPFCYYRYMRGRLTLEKVNIAINEVASYADGNAHLVACPKKKVDHFNNFTPPFIYKKKSRLLKKQWELAGSCT